MPRSTPAIDSAVASPAAFDAELDRLSAAYLQRQPVTATSLGLPESIGGDGYHGRLPDLSPQGQAQMIDVLESLSTDMQGLNPDGLSDAQQHTRELLIAQAQATLDAAAAIDSAYGEFSLGFMNVYPVNQFNSAVTDYFQVMQVQQPLGSEADAQDYVSRLNAFGPAFDNLREKMLADAQAGAVPPDFIIERTRDVIAGFLSPSPDQHSLVTTFQQRLTEAGVDTTELLPAAVQAVEGVVYPAYQRLDAALADLAGSASADAGIWDLPNGDALYERLIRLHADSTMTADEIHDYGLAEVDRIHGEIDALMQSFSLTEGSVAERLMQLSTSPEYVVEDSAEGREQLITTANQYVADLYEALDDWFGVVPTQPVEIRRVPEAIEDSQAMGYYSSPPLDGSVPGIFWMNLRDPALWPTWTIKSTTYHETAPGHHFQLALAMDRDVPVMEKLFGVGVTSGSAEGWALYTELLAKEMGFYDGDPLGDIGRLQAELFRAVRLVVDTGLHAKRWTRDQAIDYMMSAGASSGYDDAVAEVERYVVLPGQALSYKLGMRTIVDLRERAQRVQGEDFDIKAFHDRLLLARSGPLPLLVRGMNAWIDGGE